MTSRNLTEVFFLMRNNAVQNRNMYDDRVWTFLRLAQHMDVEKNRNFDCFFFCIF